MEEGFNTKITEVKRISVDMLVDFDHFCRDNNLTYYISFGSCLGAVRHGGFIPWDDDVDVDMPVRDYNRFVRLWLKYGDKENYFLQTKKTDAEIQLSFIRLRKNNTAWIDPNCENYKIHWGIPIDVFPIYNASNNRKLQKLQRKLHSWEKKSCAFAWNNSNASNIKKFCKKEESLLLLWLESVLSLLFSNSGKLYFPWGSSKVSRIISTERILPTKPLAFEGVELTGPADCDAYLTWQYGDYMTPPPEDKRGGHAIGILDLENDGEKYTGVLRRNR